MFEPFSVCSHMGQHRHKHPSIGNGCTAIGSTAAGHRHERLGRSAQQSGADLAEAGVALIGGEIDESKH